MKKKHLKLIKGHKSVETTKSVIDLVSDVDGGRVKKLTLITNRGTEFIHEITEGTTNKDVKQWITDTMKGADIVMMEYHHKNHPMGGVLDTYHRLGGLGDLWTLFLIFDDEIV